jgi:hypothetical protein
VYILTQIQSNESLYRHLESKTQKQVPLPSTLDSFRKHKNPENCSFYSIPELNKWKKLKLSREEKSHRRTQVFITFVWAKIKIVYAETILAQKQSNLSPKSGRFVVYDGFTPPNSDIRRACKASKP